MKDLKIAVIGGGSSYTPELIDGFIKRAQELPVREIYLVDIEAGKNKLEIVGNLVKRMIKKASLDIDVNLTLNRTEAIKNADFVLTQLRVGGLAARARDEHIPLKYDVLGQETTGPGGFAKAMRTIPVLLDICKDIEELAPDAWLINFTNPAGLITETILKYSKVKAIGLCNVPIHMVKNTAELLEVDSSRLQIEFAGLNHLVWGRKVYLDGKDATKEVIDKLCDGASLTMKNIPDLNWDSNYLRALSMIPCPYHRYFYMTDEMIAKMKKELELGEGTRADQVLKVEKELFEIYAEESLDTKPTQLEKRGGAYYSDAAVSLISAIYNNKKEIHTVNVRNNGAILNQPDDVVVEINAVIDSNGAHPMTVGKLPPEINGLISSVKAYELLSVEAGVTGDYNTALKALAAHPLVPSVKIAKLLLDDIIKGNKEYLPQFE